MGAEDFDSRFGGMARLLGKAGLERVRTAHVCVIGVGGVGSWTVEALVRSGIGAVTMVDMDDVCVTNVNRQLPALDGGIGRPKVDVLAERMRLIHPGCAVHTIPEFLTPGNAGRLLAGPFSWVIDAVDRMSIKAAIISQCVRQGTPVLTVGGAGGRRSADGVRVSDLVESHGDLLLRTVRKKLRRDHGFPRPERQLFGVRCVFSAEPQVFPWADGTCRATAEPGESLHMDCASGFGSATFVTGTFGFAAAGEVVTRLASGDTIPGADSWREVAADQ